MSSGKTTKRRTRIFLILAMFALALGGGAGAGFSYFYNFPELEYLRDYRPSTITRVYAKDSRLISELFQERRVPIPLSRIPVQLRQAFLAIEDARFYKHPGVSTRDIFRAFWRNLRAGRLVQGGSTITQQLAKVLFLTPERTLTRKIREALLALEIERRFTKDEILEFYLNQIYLGSGAYGVEAAALSYFGKSVGKLTLDEASTIAGLPKAPSRFNPRTRPENAIKRRRLVLKRMREVGNITPEQEAAAAEAPLRLVPRALNTSPEVAYFAERIRRKLGRRYGSALYRSGLTIRTTLDFALQKTTHTALLKGIEEINRRRGFLPASRKRKRPPRLGDRHQLLIAEIDGDAIRGSIGEFEASLEIPKSINKHVLREGDLVLGRVIKVDRDAKSLQLEWQESVQGAAVAFDPKTGALRALTGGTNFRRFQFNRATQAKRSPGSAFKPVIMAAALMKGYTPAQILMDTPFVRRLPGTLKAWKPRNYTNKFYGPVTMRLALEKSLNLATVKLLDHLKPKAAVDFAKRLGISPPLKPYLSLALGAFEITPYEFTATYIPFASGGIAARPYDIEKITDASQRILEENVPQTHRVIPPEVAYQVRSLLRGVVTDGTAKRAKKLPAFVAGKTGTTNEYRDAWFIGFSDDLILGVWVGRDDNKQMGFRASGGSAALPIWTRIMKSWLARRAPEPSPPPPPGVTLVKIDQATGLLPSPECPGRTRTEAFVQGTEPTEKCQQKRTGEDLFGG
ncbi:MAG: PBP1A family penicillin-binding protein [Nitrospinaceae bacterium]|nr:PBP1A family penicillin-binding protein [Nitrospinaceae bacterium]